MKNDKTIKKEKSLFISIIKNRYFTFGILFLILILIKVLNISGFLRYDTMSAISLILIWYIAVLGFNLLMGYSGLASLGTAGFIGIGAYFTANLFGILQLPLFVSIIAVILASVLLGTIVGFISLKIEGIYLAIVTLGLSEIILRVFIEFKEVTRGDGGINFMSIEMPKILWFIPHTPFLTFVIIALFVVIFMIITQNIMISQTGRAFLSIKNSTFAAQSLGISVLRYRLLSFVISTVYAGITGVLYAVFNGSVRPYQWNMMLSLSILAAVIIGGKKSVWASLGGTVLIFGLQPLLLDKIGIPEIYNIPNIFNGILIVLIIMFFSGGLIEIFTRLKKHFIKYISNYKFEKRRLTYGIDSDYPQAKKDFIIEQYQKVNQ